MTDKKDKLSGHTAEKTVFKSLALGGLDRGGGPCAVDVNDGKIIRITIPKLTEERRKELVKLVRKRGEEGKIALRNIRREANDWHRSLEKEKAISEDELHKGLDDIQKLTTEFIEKVDGILEEKEKEILEI